MTVLTRKFSQFVAGNVQSVVGLTTGANTIGPNSGGGGGSGAVTQVINQANSFSVGQWVRFDTGSNLYVTALATTPQNAEVIGVVIAVAPPGGPPYTQFTLQQSGYITEAQAVFGVLTPGQPQYLSDAVAGAMVNTDVLVNGEVSRPVFIPDASNGVNSSGWVLPYRGIINNGGTPTGGGVTPTPGTDSNIVTITQNGHGLNAGDWVRVSTPTVGPNQVHYVKALADTLADSQAVGVVIQVIDANTFRLQFAGYVATSVATSTTAPFQYVSAPGPVFSALVPSTVYYLSATVPGQLVSVDPGLSNGGFSKPLFVSEQTLGTVNTNAGYVLPQRPLAAAVENNPLLKVITQNGHGFTMIGTVVKPSTVTPGAYVAAIATSFVPSYGTAMIVGIPDVNTIILQEVGYVTGLDIAPPVPGGIANTATPFSLGQPYYLSTSNAPVSGQITNVEPVSPNFSKPMFMPDQTGAGWIFPMKPTIGHGGAGGGGALQLITTVNVNNGDTTISGLMNVLNGTYTDLYVIGRDFVIQRTSPAIDNQGAGFWFQVCIGGVAKNDAGYLPQIAVTSGSGTALSVIDSLPFGVGANQFSVLSSVSNPFSFEMWIRSVNNNSIRKQILTSNTTWQADIVSGDPTPSEAPFYDNEDGLGTHTPAGPGYRGISTIPFAYGNMGTYLTSLSQLSGLYFFLDGSRLPTPQTFKFISGSISFYGLLA